LRRVGIHKSQFDERVRLAVHRRGLFSDLRIQVNSGFLFHT
jgi:hypothetical protein